MKRHEYAPEWADTIRPQILRRDGYKCKHCTVGHRSRVYRDSRGKYVECDEFMENWAIDQGKRVFTLHLQVAHLNHDKNDNRVENLLSLCPSCHAKFDAAHKSILRKQLKGQPSEKSTKVPITYPDQKARALHEISAIVQGFTGQALQLHQCEVIYNVILKNQ